jgi:hypothetical protein
MEADHSELSSPIISRPALFNSCSIIGVGVRAHTRSAQYLPTPRVPRFGDWIGIDPYRHSRTVSSTFSSMPFCRALMGKPHDYYELLDPEQAGDYCAPNALIRSLAVFACAL